MVRGNLILAALVSAACSLGACAPSIVINPSWSSIPDGDAMSDAYPGFASLIGVGGSAQIRCRSDLIGNLAECESIKAVPAGMGFDRAALSLTPRFKLNPRQEDGEVEKSSVQFTVRFALPPEEPIAAWAGAAPSDEALRLARTAASLRVETTGDPSREILDNLDLDPDRIGVVTGMIERTVTEYSDRHVGAAALMLARTASEPQLRAMAQGRRPPGPIPSRDAMEAAGPELEILSQEFGARLRELYCARYACPAAGSQVQSVPSA
ncbi:MAG: hypothetical protein ACXW3K_02380 [Brevundimonas sp.]